MDRNALKNPTISTSNKNQSIDRKSEKLKLYTRIHGGLGNQLFQYAAALELARREDGDIFLDCQDLDRKDSRPLTLNRLRVEAPTADPRELSLFRFVFRRCRPWMPLFAIVGRRFLVEKSFRYQYLSLAGARFSWMTGYWQSYRYAVPVEAELREKFVPRKAATGRNAALLRVLARGKSVCVHVRRGDYVSNPSVGAVHGLVDLAYYRAALRKLKGKIGKAFVFSDDLPWVRKNFKFETSTVFVDHNTTQEPEEDLRLMAACKHFVIANSSLSWWAAWLGRDPKKRVIAPARWFAEGHRDTRDLCPAEWDRL